MCYTDGFEIFTYMIKMMFSKCCIEAVIEYITVAERAQRAATSESTSKSRNNFHHFDCRWCKCSQHKQIKNHTANAHNTTKYILFAERFFFGCVVSICSVCVVKLTKVFS